MKPPIIVILIRLSSVILILICLTFVILSRLSLVTLIHLTFVILSVERRISMPVVRDSSLALRMTIANLISHPQPPSVRYNESLIVE